jgi:hypothetical protein
MTLSRHRMRLAAVCLFSAGLASSALAQPPQGMRPRAMYDTKTEARFTGTVEAVTTMPPQGGMHGQGMPGGMGPGMRGGMMGGTHLTLKTDTETFDVHVGPTAFLDEQKISFEKGDTVEVLGSRVTLEDKPVVLAREIKKGDQVLTLRNEQGVPMWSRRGGR